MFSTNTFNTQYRPWDFPTKIYFPTKPIYPTIIPVSQNKNIDTIVNYKPPINITKNTFDLSMVYKMLSDNKTYILVTDNDDDVMDIIKGMNIEIMDKTCIEEYRIFSIKCSEYKINKIRKYNWCMNISKGH